MSSSSRLLVPLIAGALVLASARAHDGDPKLLDKRPAYMGRGWRNAMLAPGAVPLALSAPPVAFPASGVTLLAWLPLPEFGLTAGANANSCFGYVSPSGREYALLGLSSGTAFVEITQPGNPVIVAQIPGPTSLWRDMRTYSHYAYAVSEGGGGIQVMDLANIDAGSVALIGSVNDDIVSATHTLAVDPVSGYIYRSGGSSNGLRIYDVHTNPAVPARVGSWSDRYVHEPSIFTLTSGPSAGHQIAFCCGGMGGGFTQTGLYVVDVTNKASPTLLKYVSYLNSAFAHQCWPSDDRHWLYLDDELDDKNLGVTCVTRVFDISDPVNTTLFGTFTNSNTSIDHNQYVRGDTLYQSNYRSGLRVCKTSAPGTPTVPVEVAYFDTWPEDDAASFNGLWNNYPYFPSGVVIGSDLEKGLFVWWVGAPQLDFSIVGGLPEIVSPAGEVLRVQIGGALQGTPVAHVDTGTGFVATPMTLAANGDWLAAIPPSACGTPIHLYLSAQSSSGIVWTDPPGTPEQAYSIGASFTRTVVASSDFEGAAAGWTVGAASDTATGGIWTRVDPIGTDLAPENDHTSGTGTKCFVTGQGVVGGTVNAADVDGGATTLTSPAYNLAGQDSARIGYWRWYDDQVPNGAPPDDPFVISITGNGSTWVVVENLGPEGADCRGGWIHHELRVADYITPTSQVKLRFVASDTGADTHVEAGIDDVRVTTDACSGYDTFCFGDGSGLPCPCGNTGASGGGCANSTGSSGFLAASGTAAITGDTLLLSGSGMTLSSTVLYFQGDAPDGTGLGLPLGDGLRCAGGSIVRLGTKTNAGGASSYPVGADQPISVRGVVPAGATRFYQAYYRNAVSFCSSATANYTNGVAVVWGP